MQNYLIFCVFDGVNGGLMEGVLERSTAVASRNGCTKLLYETISY